MTKEFPQWHGTQGEKFRLMRCIKRNCGCSFDNGKLAKICSACKLLSPDQRIWDHLVYVRRLAFRLRMEEFGPSKPKRF